MDEGVASQGISAERPTTPTTAPRRFVGGFCLASAAAEEQRIRIRMAQIVVVVGDMVELGLHMPGKTCHLKSIVLMNILARFFRSSGKKQRKNSNMFEGCSERISYFERIPLLCHLEVGHREKKGKSAFFSEDVCPRTYLRFPRYASKEKKGYETG